MLSRRRRSFLRRDDESSDSWISVADLMAGLMMVFLLLAILYAELAQRQAREADRRREDLEAIVGQWRAVEREIYKALLDEFGDYEERWNAEVLPDLSVRFLPLKPPEKVLFQQGSYDIEPNFQESLTEFFPRFVRLMHDKFREHIDEIQIEGHASSEYGNLEGRDAFMENMGLSQARARSVLRFGLGLSETDPLEGWILETLSANGFSSSRTVGGDGREEAERGAEEDREQSRRVEFRVQTKSAEALSKLLEEINSQNGREGEQ